MARGRKRRAAEALEQPNDTPPFTITCPALPTTKRARRADVYTDFDDPGDEALKVQYMIEPGTKWSEMKSYRKMRCMFTQADLLFGSPLESNAAQQANKSKDKEHEFKQGDFILVNRDSAVASAETDRLLSELTEDEMLDWQRQHTWVGRIQQVKAVRADEVYIRVFWFYWPEELPNGGAEPYHGRREVVLSNHAEIIDSTTISSAAEIHFWNENDDADGPKGPLYWRQTIDFNKHGQNGRAGLSRVRRHCRCEMQHHPDETMYQCSYNGCAIWNHRQCLEDDLFARLEAALRDDTLESDMEQRAKHFAQKQKDHKLTIGERITVGMENMLHRISDRVLSPGQGREGSVAKNKDGDDEEKKDGDDEEKKVEDLEAVDGKVNGDGDRYGVGEAVDEESAPRENGRFTVTVKRKGATKSVAAEVRLRPSSGKKEGDKVWEIQLDCLVCENPLD